MRDVDMNKKIKSNIGMNALQVAQPGYGIVLDYDTEENTATVLLAKPGSDAPGEFFTNVPCPTHSGLQIVAPEPGRPCWVSFRDGTQAYPVVTHFFNSAHAETEYYKQYNAEIDIPRFMLEI